MLKRRPLLIETLTAVGLVVAPFVLPYLGFAPNTVNRILVWGLFGVGFDILFGYTGLLSFGQSAFDWDAAADLPADGVQPEAAIGVVQRPTLSNRHDGDMLRQPGVLQIEEPGVLNTQPLIAPGELAHRHLSGPIHAVGRPPRSARSLIPRSIRWVITKATTATGSTSNGAHR